MLAWMSGFAAVSFAATLRLVCSGDSCGPTCADLATISADAPAFGETGAAIDSGSYKLTSTFSTASYQAAGTQFFISGYTTIYQDYPQWSEIGVYVNGAFYEKVAAGAAGVFQQCIPLPVGNKTVTFVSGLQSSPSQSLTPFGTFFVSAKSDAVMTVITPSPTNRILVYGDSIAVGGNSTTPESQAWPMIVRNAYAPKSLALEAFGYRSLNIDTMTPTKRAAFVAKLVAYAPERIWFAIGTNDYGLSRWSAASFGTAYAATLDDLHAALPSATIFAQTPLVRGSEVVNVWGNTLSDYRAQIVTVQSTRSSFVTLIDGTSILTLSDISDGVHPTTAGHVKYATFVRTALGI